MLVSFISNLQNPAFFKKFIINNIVPSNINNKTVLKFQVYSSHHITKQHLINITSISLQTIKTLKNNLINLTIIPQTIFKINIKKQTNTIYKNIKNNQY